MPVPRSKLLLIIVSPFISYSCRSALQQYIRTILVLLSTRLQSSKTSNFTYSFVYFFCFVLAIQKEGLTPDFIVSQYESVQAG